VVFMLVVFTFGLPLLVSGMLLINRKALYNPKVHATMGFLYARFQKGSEFWEMHEVVRKCALMGLLIFLPATSRAAVGILICVVCCCTLNYFQPHRNKMVLFVSQMSFLMSTFKYVCAVFLRLNDLQQEDAAVMGWIMVMLDVVFLLGSVVAVVLIVVLLRASATTLQENKAAVAEDNDGERIAQNRSLVKVVPTPQEDEQQKSNLKKEITALKWQKNIRQTLMNNSKRRGFKSAPNTSYCFADDDATHSRNLSGVPFRWVFVECCFGLPTIHVRHHPLRVPCGHMLVE
jgi:hypothetical protein